MAEVPDAVKGAGHMHKVLLENDRVRVLEYHAKPGDVAEMHSHPDGVIYHLSGRVRRSTAIDGQIQEFDIAPGAVIWIPATKHRFEIPSGEECRGLHIELK
jgi:quercetin dioxygenase-like cupin family protein